MIGEKKSFVRLHIPLDGKKLLVEKFLNEKPNTIICEKYKMTLILFPNWHFLNILS